MQRHRAHARRRDSPGIEAKSREGVAVDDWSHLAVSYDGSGTATGIQIYIDGRNIPTDVANDKLAGDFANKGELQIGNKDWGIPFKGSVCRFQNLRPASLSERGIGIRTVRSRPFAAADCSGTAQRRSEKMASIVLPG